MMDIKCPKCDSTEIILKKDARGIAEARCAKCGAYVKKMSTSELMDYYEERLNGEDCGDDAEVAQPVEDNRPPCRWCKEHYFYRLGPRGISYIPVETVYCPRCGRKLKPTDRDY